MAIKILQRVTHVIFANAGGIPNKDWIHFSSERQKQKSILVYP